MCSLGSKEKRKLKLKVNLKMYVMLKTLTKSIKNYQHCGILSFWVGVYNNYLLIFGYEIYSYKDLSLKIEKCITINNKTSKCVTF